MLERSFGEEQTAKSVLLQEGRQISFTKMKALYLLSGLNAFYKQTNGNNKNKQQKKNQRNLVSPHMQKNCQQGYISSSDMRMYKIIYPLTQYWMHHLRLQSLAFI